MLDERRPHPARRDGIDTNRRAIVDRHVTRERGDSALRRRVGSHAVRGRPRVDRRHVDDRALPQGLHVGNHVLRQEEHALQIDRQTAVPAFARRVEYGRVGTDARVVHEDVDLSVGLERLPYDLLDLLLVGDVTLDKDRVAALAADLVGGLASRFLAPIDDDDPRALAREHLGDPLADSCGRTRDDRDFVLQLHGKASCSEGSAFWSCSGGCRVSVSPLQRNPP